MVTTTIMDDAYTEAETSRALMSSEHLRGSVVSKLAVAVIMKPLPMSSYEVLCVSDG